MRGISEAGVDIAQCGEGADHEQRADQEHKGHGDLRNDENAARTLTSAARAGSAVGAGKSSGSARARVFECRNRAEEQSRDDG